jgi:integrase
MLGKIIENERKGSRYIVRFKQAYKRFDDLREAEQFLNTLRYKEGRGEFDERDYQKNQPLGFHTMSQQWLKMKDVRCKRNLINHINYAKNYFHNKNIKEIDYPELEDFFHQLPEHLSNKSKYNIRTTLHTFFAWVVKRNRRAKVRIEMPEFPDIKFELGWRKTVDKATQQEIIEEVKRISYDINPKIWLGVLWLSTYVNVRPIELIHVKEKDINLEYGIMNIRHNKEQKPKMAYLLDEDVELLKSMPRGFPELYFFRHGKRKGVALKKRGQFGKDYLYTWWRRACKNLGVEGVPLYPGTKHSSVIALGDTSTPEEIKKYGTGHETNKAFDRYFQVDGKKKRDLLVKTRCSSGAHRKSSTRGPQVIEFTSVNGAEGGT